MAGQRIVIGRGKTTVEIGGELRDYVDRLVDAAAPNTRRILDETTTRIYAEAAAQWPVKTGRSRAALDHGIRFLSATEIEGFVTNDAPYAYYIKSLKLPKTGSAFVELLRKPLRKSVAAAVDALAADIAASRSR